MGYPQAAFPTGIQHFRVNGKRQSAAKQISVGAGDGVSW
jgi:hypothetical protein